MRKKILSTFLIFSVCVSLGVPASAKTLNPDTLYPKAPKKVVRQFKNWNGHVEKVSNIPGNPGYYQGNHSWVWCGNPSTCQYVILVNTKISHVTYHELGHAVAFMYWAKRGNFEASFPDETAKWKKIYRKERKKYHFENRSNVTRNSSEYFAQCFASYCLHKKKMKRTLPKSYRYIKQIIRGL